MGNFSQCNGVEELRSGGFVLRNPPFEGASMFSPWSALFQTGVGQSIMQPVSLAELMFWF